MPDPERLGGLGWTRRTKGALTSAERRRLCVAIARGQAENAGRPSSCAWAGRRRARRPSCRTRPTRRSRATSQEACDEQPPAIRRATRTGPGRSAARWPRSTALDARPRGRSGGRAACTTSGSSSTRAGRGLHAAQRRRRRSRCARPPTAATTSAGSPTRSPRTPRRASIRRTRRRDRHLRAGGRAARPGRTAPLGRVAERWSDEVDEPAGRRRPGAATCAPRRARCPRAGSRCCPLRQFAADAHRRRCGK